MVEEILLFLSLIALASAGGVEVVPMEDERPSCVILLEQPTGCLADGTCVRMRNDRKKDAVSVILPNYCGGEPIPVLNPQGGMKIVDDPWFGNVSVIPPMQWVSFYPPIEEVLNRYGEPAIKVVSRFKVMARAYNGEFTTNTLLPLNSLHSKYMAVVNAWDCAEQNHLIKGDSAVVFGSDCNNQ